MGMGNVADPCQEVWATPNRLHQPGMTDCVLVLWFISSATYC